jgi:hypothetical protein
MAVWLLVRRGRWELGGLRTDQTRLDLRIEHVTYLLHSNSASRMHPLTRQHFPDFRLCRLVRFGANSNAPLRKHCCLIDHITATGTYSIHCFQRHCATRPDSSSDDIDLTLIS